MTTTRNSKRSKPSLPNWSRLIVPKKIVTNSSTGLSVAEEERSLRTWAYHSVSRNIDRAFHTSLEQLAKPVQDILNHHRSESSVKEEEDSLSLEEIHKQRYLLQPPSKYHPLALPLYVLHGPYHSRDRQEWMKYVAQATKISQPRSCVVMMLGKDSHHHNQNPIAHLTRQCLLHNASSMVEHRTAAAMRTLLRERTSVASCTDLLVAWASQTNYDRILVFGDCPDSDWVQWLAERRAHQGLPFELIAMTGPSSPLSYLRSTQLGPNGLWVQQVELATATEVLDGFWRQLVVVGSSSPTLLVLPDELCTRMRRCYAEEDGSAVNVILKLKQYLAHTHLTPGCFLLKDSSGQSSFDAISEWFVSCSEALELVRGNLETKTEVMNLLKDIAELKDKMHMIQHVKVVLCLNSDSPAMLANRPASSSTLSNIAVQSILSQLMDLRNKAVAQDLSSSAIDVLHKLMIVVDNCHNRLDIHCCLELESAEWSKLLAKWQDTSIHPALQSANPEPRRHTVAGLMRMSSDDNNGADGFRVSDLTGLVYRLIQTHTSVSIAEWYNLFEPHCPSQWTTNESFAMFACGVRSLQVGGLVRERRIPGKSGVFYDKTVLSWCSGA